MEEFVVCLEKSEYPIDALLLLVKEKKLDIKEVKLADVADDFMEFVEKMEFLDLEIMSEFIALASDLIKIKSLSLIPSTRTYAKKMENRIKTSLEEREKLLKKAKEIVDFIKFIESVKPIHIGKSGKTTPKPIVKNNLYKAFYNAKKRIEFREKLKYIAAGKFSVSKSIKNLKKILDDREIRLMEFLKDMEKMEKISYIVAMLEIVKEDFAYLIEKEKEILIIKNK